MRGRPRIHVDDQARKRDYYQRNKLAEQKKARARYHARQAQKKDEEEVVRADLARRASLMPRTAKLTRGTMAIAPNMHLDALQRALTHDLDGWRTHESDRAQFKAFTQVALEWHDQGKPESDLRELLQRPLDIVKAVRQLARAAVQVADERSTVTSPSKDPSLLKGVVTHGDRLMAALNELVTLYGYDDQTLRRFYKEQTLAWQL